MKYIPKVLEDNTIVLDKILGWEECLDYAIANQGNVLYTETTSVSSVEVIMAFQKKGYMHELYEVPVHAPDGMELNPKIYCKFIYVPSV